MTPLDDYRLLVAEIERERLRHGLPVTNGSLPCGGCRECCRSVSLLPIEAALLQGVPSPPERDDRPEDCCPLLADARCLAGDARPVVCRLRGLPFLVLSADGDPACSRCGKGGAAGGRPSEADGCAPIGRWVARLWQLNQAWCRMAGIPVHRVSFSRVDPRQRLIAGRPR
jgi:hypothetical protein